MMLYPFLNLFLCFKILSPLAYVLDFENATVFLWITSDIVFFSWLQQADETLDFEEQILEAAKSIAAATSALVKSASAAQRELVAQGKVGKKDKLQQGKHQNGIQSLNCSVRVRKERSLGVINENCLKTKTSLYLLEERCSLLF